MALPSTVNRVPAHTAEHVNQQIRLRTERSVAYYRQHPQQITHRLRELDREWDIERTLEANAATLVVAGAVLGRSTASSSVFRWWWAAFCCSTRCRAGVHRYRCFAAWGCAPPRKSSTSARRSKPSAATSDRVNRLGQPYC
jgi:hypothetical protein